MGNSIHPGKISIVKISCCQKNFYYISHIRTNYLTKFTRYPNCAGHNFDNLTLCSNHRKLILFHPIFAPIQFFFHFYFLFVKFFQRLLMDDILFFLICLVRISIGNILVKGKQKLLELASKQVEIFHSLS